MLNMNDNFITPEGRFLLAYSENEGLLCTKIPYSPEKKSIYEIRICGDLMTGKEFYEEVDCGGIIDYDGILGNVFVDGFESNLGLSHYGLSQSGFMVDGNTWLRLRDEFDIMVEWCNK